MVIVTIPMIHNGDGKRSRAIHTAGGISSENNKLARKVFTGIESRIDDQE